MFSIYHYLSRTIRIKQANQNNKLILEPKFKAAKDTKNKVKAIKNSAVYATKAKSQLLELYYLVF